MLVNILLSISALSLLLILVNFFTVVRVNKAELITQSVAVLIPMRNEELHAAEVVKNVLQSKHLESFSLIVLDDGSTDNTGIELASIRDPRLTVINGKILPAGWLGKPHACQQLADLAEKSGAEFLIFLDADVRLSEDAIAAAISEMRHRSWDFISPHPREIARSPIAHLIQPLMQWSWCASVPIRLGISLSIPSMAIANGQWIIVKAAAYRRAGGHSAVREQVLEDLELARTLVRSGAKGGVAFAPTMAECAMYETDAQMWRGYRKSLWRAFGNGAPIAATILLVTQVLPLALALAGVHNAWKVVALNAVGHALVAYRTRSTLINLLLHPVAITIFIAMLIDSIWARRNGNVVWKDRKLS